MQPSDLYWVLGVLTVLYAATLFWVVLQQRTIARALRERREAEAELYRQARIDFLTGIYNRQGFQEFADREVARAKRYGRPLAALILDLDNLKAINDQLGHQAGDEALREVANALRASLRVTDIAARYGGDEFVVLLPETGLPGAQAVADKVRQALSQLSASGRFPIPLSASLGFSAGGDFGELLRRADEAMYAEKFSRAQAGAAATSQEGGQRHPPPPTSARFSQQLP